jgi:hypothetical protein
VRQYSGRVANEKVEVAPGYHERTKHSEQWLCADPRHLDWDNQPVAFKLYCDLETIPLSRQLEPGTVSALRAISALVGRETEPTECPVSRRSPASLYRARASSKALLRPAFG